MAARRYILALASFALLYTVIAYLLTLETRGTRITSTNDVRPEEGDDLHLTREFDASVVLFDRNLDFDNNKRPGTQSTGLNTIAQKAASEPVHDGEASYRRGDNLNDRPPPPWHVNYNLSISPDWYALRRPLESFEYKLGQPLTSKQISQLQSEARLANEHGEAAKRFPTTLIIGVRKAGTRALLAILSIHPQVKSCGPEVHFFDQRYRRGLLWYLDQTPRITRKQQTIEKTPSYFVVRDVPQRILNYSRAINKTLKFLVIFRDPSIRAISDYVQLNVGVRTKYDKPLEPFEDMIMSNRSTGLINTEWGVVKTGVYAKHLKRWLKYFPKSWFHFVSGEELVRNPYREIKMVESFLGIKPYFKRDNFVFNPTKGFPCFRGNNGNLRCLGKTKGRAHPNVDKWVKGELRRYYRPFNKELYNMTNRNFHWP